MIILPPCINTFVSGPVASGKTHLLIQWIKPLTRVVAFDATGEFVSDETMEHIWFSPATFLRRMEANQYAFRIAYHPGRDVLDDFEWCVKILFQFDSVKTLAVDEFHLVCPNNAIGDDMEVLLRFARHAKVGIIGMSQRVADVHKLFTSGCRMVILFYTEESRDIEAISDRWGKDTAEMVANLRPLVYDDSTGTTHQIPQCVVKLKGQKARIYDFESQSFVGAKSSDEEENGAQENPTEETSEPENVEESPEQDSSASVSDLPV